MPDKNTENIDVQLAKITTTLTILQWFAVALVPSFVLLVCGAYLILDARMESLVKNQLNDALKDDIVGKARTEAVKRAADASAAADGAADAKVRANQQEQLAAQHAASVRALGNVSFVQAGRAIFQQTTADPTRYRIDLGDKKQLDANHQGDKSNRFASVRISFPSKYKTPPKVVVGIAELTGYQSPKHRVVAEATSVAEDGFELLLTQWEALAGQVQISWIAVGN
jgi:hypothetical protein